VSDANEGLFRRLALAERVDHQLGQVTKLVRGDRSRLIAGCREPPSGPGGVVDQDPLSGGTDGAPKRVRRSRKVRPDRSVGIELK
jgi:hypothetical protein